MARWRALAERHPWSVPVAILGLAVALRLAGFDKSVWIDELDSYKHATAGSFAASLRENVHPPLYFSLLRAATTVSQSFTVLRLLSLAAGLLILVLLLRRRPLAQTWAAGLLVACSPELVYQAQELRHYALLTLFLTAAFLCLFELLSRPESRAHRWGLGVSLVLAAATHLVTGFFLIALALVLAWHHRRAPWRKLFVLELCFVPAGVTLLVFNRLILSVGHGLGPASWWMGAATFAQLWDALSIATGWEMIAWSASAVGRHVPGGQVIVLLVAGGAAAFLFAAAFGHRAAGLPRMALAIALTYWGLITVFSFNSLSILLPRILVPGTVPLLFAIGTGIAAQPAAPRRHAANLVVVGLALAMTGPWWWHFAWVPREDLRGLAEAVRTNQQPAELPVFLSGTEVAVEAYWPGRTPRGLTLNLLAPLEPQTPPVRAALAHDTIRSVLLVYRDDGYFQKHPTFLPQLLDFFARHGFARSRILWDRSAYHVIRLTPGAGAAADVPPAPRL